MRDNLKECSTGKLKDVVGITSNEIFNRIGGYGFTCESVDESGYRFAGRTIHASAPYKDLKAAAGIYLLAWTEEGRIYVGAGRRGNRLVFVGGVKKNPAKTAMHLEEQQMDELLKMLFFLSRDGDTQLMMI